VTMLITAWCLRAFGIAQTFIVAVVVFVVGSFMGALAQSAETLLVSRLVQGAGAGLVMPISMVVMAQVFPLSQRGMAMGIMGVGTILAPALGPTLGGYLVDHFSWRWVFIAAVPFVLVSIPMAAVLYPKREETGARASFDWMGTFLFTIFILALLIALADGQRYGWYQDQVVIAAAIGIASLVLWIAWEFYVPEPILELRLFLNPRFSAAAVVTFTVGIGLYGSTYVFPLFLQSVSRLIATESGLLMAPAGLVMVVLFPAAGRLADLTSPKLIILIGLVLFALSNYPMIAADSNTPVIDLVLWYVLGRIGLAFIFPSLNAAAINPLPLELIPHGSGAVNFLRQLGGAFGINLISMAMTEQKRLYADAANATQTWDNAATMELIRLSQEQFSYLGMIGYHGFEASFGYVLSVVSAQSNMLAYRDSFLLIGLVFVLSLVPAWFIGKRTR